MISQQSLATPPERGKRSNTHHGVLGAVAALMIIQFSLNTYLMQKVVHNGAQQ
jgi:hypothetical protein